MTTLTFIKWTNQSFRIFPNAEWNLKKTLIKKNVFGKYTSHNQRRQLSSFQNLIFESLIHSDARLHILGSKHDVICVPWYSDLIFLWLKWALFQRLHDVSFFLKIIPRAILGCTLYIYVASTCRFWWWILKDWYLSSSSSNCQIYSYKQVPNPFQEVYWFNCS